MFPRARGIPHEFQGCTCFISVTAYDQTAIRRIPDNIVAFRERVSDSLKFLQTRRGKWLLQKLMRTVCPASGSSYGDPGDQVLIYLHGGGYVLAALKSSRTCLAVSQGERCKSPSCRLQACAGESVFRLHWRMQLTVIAGLLEQGYAPG